VSCPVCAEREAQLKKFGDLIGSVASIRRIGALRLILGISPAEAWLLNCLYDADGEVMTRRLLHRTMPPAMGRKAEQWGHLDVFVHRLRKRIGTDMIRTVYAKGFTLSPEGIALVTEAFLASSIVGESVAS